MSEDSGKARPWYGRIWFWLPALLIVVLGVLLALLPYGVHWYLAGWLKDQGVEGVKIGDIEVNPFTGFLGAETVILEGDADSSTAAHVEINLSWHELPGRRVMLSRISLHDAKVTIRRTDAQGWIIAAIVLGAREAVETAQAAEAATGWGFGFGGVEIRNVTVRYAGPMVEQEVLIEQASLDAFSTWNPDRPTELSADLVVDGTRVSLRGRGKPFATTPEGHLEVEHGALDLPPFASVAALAGVSRLDGEMTADYRLTLDAFTEGRLSASLDGRFGFEGLGVETPALSASAHELRWEGPASIETRTSGMTLAMDGTIAGRGLDAVVNAGNGNEEAGAAASAEQAGGSSGQAGAEGGAEVGDESGAPPPARARGLAQAGAAELDWDFDGELVTEGSRIEVRGAGQVSATDLALFLAAPGSPGDPAAPGALHASLARLEGEGQAMNLVLDEALLDLGWEGGARLEAARMQVDPLLAGMESGDWSGRVATRTDAEGRRITLDGTLALTGATGGREDGPVRGEVGRVEWEGLAVVTRGESWGVSAEGSVSLGEVTLDPRTEGPRLAAIDAVEAELAGGEGDVQTVLRALTAREVRLLAREGKGAKWILTLPEATLDGGRLGVGRIALGTLRLQDARAHYEIDADGEPEYKRILAGLIAQEPEPERAPLAIAVEGVETVGQGSFRYVDRSVEPVVDVVIEPLSITVGKLDTAAPDAYTDLALDGAIGKYTDLSFEGRANPLAASLSATGNGSVSALNMPLLSPYAKQMLGYAIERGTLEGTFDLNIDQGYMDSTAELVIRQLEVRKLRPEESQEVEQQIGASLDTALALLEDDDQTIRLELPLEGKLGELQVSAQDAIEQVIQKGLTAGIKTAAVAYFAPLWPALAVSKILDLASALSFQPVAFPPGDAGLGDPQRDYLDKMARLLADRPKVSVALCGVAVASDVRALEEAAAADQAGTETGIGAQAEGDSPQGDASADAHAAGIEARLKGLARQRQEAVLDRLIDAGISKNRLAACDPEVRRNDDGQPRVELGV